MVTSLGHGQVSQLIFHVKNTGAAAIPKGQLVKHTFGTAITFTETGDPVLAVQRMNVTDGVAGEGGIVLGVMKETLGAGKTGEVVHYGLAQAVLLLAEAQQTVLAAHDTGALLDAAAATHETPIAINIEPTTVNLELAWCFIDCISAMAHLASLGATDTFHGVGY